MTNTAPGLPAWAVGVAGAGLAAIGVPVLTLVAGANWTTWPAAISSPAARSALWLSVSTALVATGACVVLGLPLALMLARARGWLASVLRAVVLVPLVLPPLVGGLALLLLLGRRGPLGQLLAATTGYVIPFTTPAVIVAQTFVAMPFLVISAEGGLRSIGADYARVAASLGAGPSRVLRTVTLPMLAPALRGGVVLCFARALGEFGATALFAGNLPGTTQTMPLAIYTAFNGAGVAQDTAVALSVLLVGCALVLLAASGLLAFRGHRS